MFHRCCPRRLQDADERAHPLATRVPAQDGLLFANKQWRYEEGVSPAVLVWKDASISPFVGAGLVLVV